MAMYIPCTQVDEESCLGDLRMHADTAAAFVVVVLHEFPIVLAFLGSGEATFNHLSSLSLPVSVRLLIQLTVLLLQADLGARYLWHRN